MKQSEWFNLYSESWKGEIVDEAFCHPAKFSRALIRQIYKHMLAEGYIKPGDSIVDCFGGVALGGLDAMRYGLHWYGVELEARFCSLGQQNIELWNGRYSQWFENWGTAVLLRGDSRRLADVLGEAGGCVSSPPFHSTEGAHSANKYGNPEKVAGDMARKYQDGTFKGHTASKEAILKSLQKANEQTYGNSPGQLGSMKEGDLDNALDAALSSPPYAETISKGDGSGQRYDAKTHKGDNATKNSSQAAYGVTPGQLGAMDGGISSPPYWETKIVQGADGDIGGSFRRGERDRDAAKDRDTQYNKSSPENLGNETGETFWSAARVILEQLYIVLKPGAYAAFVCGDFVRKGQRVYFGRQWLALCEAVGFEGVEWITCWKREPGPVQTNFLGDDVDNTKDRVSFFRRLANDKNPDNAILNEDVIIVRKPL